jgi:hypothetical protein
MAETVTIKQVEKAIRKHEAWIIEATKAAYHDEAQDVMRKSQRLVPVDTGRLRSSKFVALPVATSSRISQLLGYATVYAESVHEGNFPSVDELKPAQRRAMFARLKRNKGRRSKVGGTKYLEIPMREAASGFDNRIAKRAKIKWERRDFAIRGAVSIQEAERNAATVQGRNFHAEGRAAGGKPEPRKGGRSPKKGGKK